LFGGLGNSLEPVTTLSFLQIFLLILGFNAFCQSQWLAQVKNSALLMLYITVSQGLGFCLGFSGIFGYPVTTFGTVMMSFGAGAAVWLITCILALWPHYLFLFRFPDSRIAVLVFPTCYTMVHHVIVGNTFSTFPVYSNSVLDFMPLRQTATLFGISSITFLVVFLATLLATVYKFPNTPVTKLQTELARSLPLVCGCLVVLFTVTGFIIQGNAFYQINVTKQIMPSLPVSCIFAQSAEENSLLREQVWNTTRQQLSLGDKIVLWAEESFFVNSTEDESRVIAEAQVLAARYKAYIGVSYMMQISDRQLATNQFALVASDGEFFWYLY
jgi:apolipoprotein N-acyltransferase